MNQRLKVRREDGDAPARLYAVIETEVEASANPFWELLLSRLEPWLQTELKDVTFSDGIQTYMPRVVWLLLGHYEARGQQLN
jgi:hypothetical protein